MGFILQLNYQTVLLNHTNEVFGETDLGIFDNVVFWVEWLMLSAVLGVGLHASFADIYSQKVPNVWTMGLMGVGLAGQGTMYVYGITEVHQIAGVIICSIAIGVGMTLVRVWGPGHGKLFLGTALTLPPTLCPSFHLLSLHSASTL